MTTTDIVVTDVEVAADTMACVKRAVPVEDEESRTFKRVKVENVPDLDASNMHPNDTCLSDAVYNGLRAHCFEGASQARLREFVVPDFSNNPKASWKSVSLALSTLDYPFAIEPVTSQFRAKPGLMTNLIRTSGRVFIVALIVNMEGVEGVYNRHCVMLSTIAEEGKPYGKIIDNHGKVNTVKKKDANDKGTARQAWRLLMEHNPAVQGRKFSVNIANVYELQCGEKRVD